MLKFNFRGIVEWIFDITPLMSIIDDPDQLPPVDSLDPSTCSTPAIIQYELNVTKLVN